MFRKFMGWVFAIECVFFALVVWIIHYPPQHGRPFINGGDNSPLLTIVEVCGFYFAVIFTTGIAGWTILKEKESSWIWGIAASIASLFWYTDPTYWYQINQRGVWVHWAICALGLIAFIAPQPERLAANANRDSPSEELPNAGVCYAFGVIFPVVYLLTHRRNQQNPFLRFHCIQCLILFTLGGLCNVWRKGWPGDASSVAFLIIFVCYFIAMYKATRRKQFRLPLVSSLAERLA